MKLFKFATASLSAATAILVASNPVSAVQNPAFTSCLTPTGTVIANFDSGEHGIPDIGSKIGKDKVYSITDGNAMQCFCGTDGNGIQTNWRYVGEMSENEIKIYTNDGWIYIPDGTAWGLSQGAYLAKNINYSCGGSSTTNGSSGGSSTVQSSTGTSSTSLASTGNLLFIAEVIGAGIILTLIGLYLRHKAN